MQYMLIKLNSYMTWSRRETVPSVQLPLNAVFFCLVEVASDVILWCQCSRSIALRDQVEACFKFRFTWQTIQNHWCHDAVTSSVYKTKEVLSVPLQCLLCTLKRQMDSYWSISCFGSFQKVKQSLKQTWAMTAFLLVLTFTWRVLHSMAEME